MQVYLIIGLIFALLVAIFAVQNTTMVEITFFTWRFQEISLVLVILGSAAIGALCIFLFSMLKQMRQVLRIKELENENSKLKQEREGLLEQLEELKNQQDKFLKAAVDPAGTGAKAEVGSPEEKMHSE